MTIEREPRRATETDLDGIMSVFTNRRVWLRETKLSNQWADVQEWRLLIRFLVRHGQVWVLDHGESIIGTVTLGTAPDIDFWSDSARQKPALYVSKLATDVGCKGQGLGARLLDWAGVYASRRGIRTLRLDTSKTSDDLREYYVNLGWKHVDTVDLAHRQSGSLFEREAAPPPRTLLDAPTGQFAALRWPPAL